MVTVKIQRICKNDLAPIPAPCIVLDHVPWDLNSALCLAVSFSGGAIRRSELFFSLNASSVR